MCGRGAPVLDFGQAHQTDPHERRSDLELAGVGLDGPDAQCAD